MYSTADYLFVLTTGLMKPVFLIKKTIATNV